MLGYANDSNGFPYDRTRHPIFQRKTPFDKIKEKYAKDNHLIIELRHEDKPW